MTDPEGVEPAEPTPAADPSESAVATSAWAQHQPADQPRRSLSRHPVVVVVAWVVAAALIQAAVQATSTASFATGYALGTALAPLVLTVLVAVILGFIRDRRISRSTFTTAWIPIVATGVLLVRAFSAAAAVPPEVDPATALRVGPGYTIVATDAATAAQFDDLVANERSARSSVVRFVDGEDGSRSIFMVVDFALKPNISPDEFRAGVAAGLGRSLTTEVIDGTTVQLFEQDGTYGAVWAEPPHAVYVFAADAAGLRSVVTSILEAG